MPAARDEDDLLELEPARLQRALLRVPDALLAQALAAAEPKLAARLEANLSRRRAGALGQAARRLREGADFSARAARAALRNLVRSVFELAGPEAEGSEASRQIAAPAGPPPPDLTPGAFGRLKELRAVAAAVWGASPFVQELELGRKGRAGAVLVRRWLGRRRTPGSA